MMYYHGLGVEQDYKQAKEWFENAAEQEQADAQYQLGEMYWSGHEIPQDSKKSLKYYNLFISKALNFKKVIIVRASVALFGISF